MMSVPLMLMIASKFVTTYHIIICVVAILGTGYDLMGELVKVNRYPEETGTTITCLKTLT